MNGRHRDRDETLDEPLHSLLASDPPKPSFHTEPVARWGPEPGPGQIVGFILLLLAIAALIVSARQFGESEGIVRALWVLVGGTFLLASVGISVLIVRLRSFRYTVGTDSVVVESLGRRLEISHSEIVDVTFRPRDRIVIEGYERYWPGYSDALTMTSEGMWRSVATAPPNERVRMRLRSGLTVAISPERPVLFVEALEARRHGFNDARQVVAVDALEALVDVPPVSGSRAPQSPRRAVVAPVLSRHFERAWRWRPEAAVLFRERIVEGDPVSSNLLALNLLTLICLLFIAGWKGDAVNQPLAVHWNAEGEPSWYVRPDGFWIIEGLWIFPLTTAAIIAVNTALATLAAAFDRIAEARLLLSGALITSLLVLAAMLQTTGVI